MSDIWFATPAFMGGVEIDPAIYWMSQDGEIWRIRDDKWEKVNEQYSAA